MTHPFLSGADETGISRDKIEFCYETDAMRFGEILVSPSLQGIATRYLNEPGRRSPRTRTRQIALPPPAPGSRAIDASQYTEQLSRALASAQIAVCCNLFHGHALDLDHLNKSGLRAFARNIVNQSAMKDGKFFMNHLVTKLQFADTIRCVQTLRHFGWMSQKHSATRQLSLGAAHGLRDLNAVHADYRLKAGSAMMAPGTTLPARIGFLASNQRAAHTVLVDNDPQHGELYRRYSGETQERTNARPVMALSLDTYSALDYLADKIREGETHKRNLVVAFRIDHLMLPDVSDFFTRLAGVVNTASELLMTIGAGDTDDDFRGRIECLDRIQDYLSERGMTPLRIRFDRGNSPHERRAKPLFGITEIASYELLYCWLAADRLS